MGQASSGIINIATRLTIRIEEERLRVSRKVEARPFSLQQVAFQARPRPLPPEEEASWKPYLPPEQEDKRRRTRRRGGIAVGSFATRMIQRERGRGGRRVVADPQARALEEAAKRWEARRTNRNPRG